MDTQTPPIRLVTAIATVGLLFAQMMPAFAQAPVPSPPSGIQEQPDADPPARVGRLARVSGQVSFHGQDDTQWSPATLNFPVASGSAFWTQPDARAEIEVSASRIVMAPGTELDVTSLTDTAFQATEPQGEIYLQLRGVTAGDTYAVQTPRGMVTVANSGRYGIAAGDVQNPTVVTVLEGSARVEGPGVMLDVGPGQTATITGVDTFQGQVGPAQRDAFLTAMLEAERAPVQPAVVPPPAVAAMPGGEDLASYGTWSESPEYGQVWYPEVAPDWAPYRDGSWAYVGPWGWTWVDSEPWGFAPFHYGRWAQLRGRWCWVPGAGRFGPRPVYAPALVTFFGVGAVGVGVGAALAAGRVGWVPLGPREPFHPWYRTSDRYFRQINAPHVANITTVNRNVAVNNFVNRGAVTMVPVSAMTASRPVRPSLERVDPSQLALARPVLGQQPVRPAATTFGVTPAVARQLNLPQSTQPFHSGSPGPAIRATPTVISPGVATGGWPVRPGLPPLHGPVPPTVPASVGMHSVGHPLPPLRPPVPPGQAVQPQIQHQPFGGPGAVTHTVPMVNQGTPPAPNVVHPAPQFANPAATAPFARAPSPGAIRPAPVAPVHPGPGGWPTPSPGVHAAPPPVPQVHAPPPQMFHPAANPPPAFHPATPLPAPHFSPPPQAHPPPPQPAQHKRPGEP